jgi:hypothetical protein
VVLAGALLSAQMPDPRQMSGIPRPVTDLPDGAVSVRVVRGTLSNNVTNQDVELRVNGKATIRKTDANGRAEFTQLPAGATVQAAADVDGEHLESERFPAPGKGGIRLLLVAAGQTTASAPPAREAATTGTVTLGGNSRIVLEPGDESVQIYYLLDVVNDTATPVNPPSLFVFDMPTGSVGCSVLEGSSDQAKVNGTRVRVQGPFAPGPTPVQVACELPSTGASIDVTQRFPTALPRLAVIVKKVGPTKLVSPQIDRQQDMTAQGEDFIVASGPQLAAGQPLSLSLADLPHHSPAPRMTALILAALIVIAGIWAASSRSPETAAARRDERRQLLARKNRLLDELVRLERDRRDGRVADRQFAVRREDLVAALEHVYGALDDEPGPEPIDRAGVAA